MVIYETNNFLAHLRKNLLPISTKVADNPVELANRCWLSYGGVYSLYLWNLPPNENRNRYAIGANLSE